MEPRKNSKSVVLREACEAFSRSAVFCGDVEMAGVISRSIQCKHRNWRTAEISDIMQKLSKKSEVMNVECDGMGKVVVSSRVASAPKEAISAAIANWSDDDNPAYALAHARLFYDGSPEVVWAGLEASYRWKGRVGAYLESLRSIHGACKDKGARIRILDAAVCFASGELEVRPLRGLARETQERRKALYALPENNPRCGRHKKLNAAEEETKTLDVVDWNQTPTRHSKVYKI